MTITGVNFSAVKSDNNVFLSSADDDYNIQCIITSSSKTEIKCITPIRNFDEEATLRVIVQGRLIEESIGHFTFTYDTSVTPSIEQPLNNLLLSVGESFNILGKNFK